MSFRRLPKESAYRGEYISGQHVTDTERNLTVASTGRRADTNVGEGGWRYSLSMGF